MTLGDLPHRLFLWLRCHFPRVTDLREIEVRSALHPGGARRIHLLAHWVQRLLVQDPAAIELLCRQLVELEDRSRRRAVQRARELRAQWEAWPGRSNIINPAARATTKAPAQN